VRYSFLLLMSVLLLSHILLAQKKPDVIKAGVVLVPFYSLDEFSSIKRIQISWLARGIVRIGIDDYLNGEIGAGYGEYKGLDFQNTSFSTSIIPVDFRLLFKFIKKDSYPYLFLGGGILFYDVQEYPSSVSPKITRDNGYAAFAPFGVGMQFRLGYYISMDINTGFTVTSTDHLNYYKDQVIPDMKYFAGISLILGAGGPTDNDKDGLMSDTEEEIGTDPENPDTDGDGLNDGEELLKFLQIRLIPTVIMMR
jgi:hypothetical protein